MIFKKRVIILFFVIFTVFLNVYKSSLSPPCLNADEAAFGYNAYSLLKTGKDEYGNKFPLRFKSFEDYKLPLYGYGSIPIISAFGLNESSTRALNTLVIAGIVVISYLLSVELFKSTAIGILTMFMVSTSIWVRLLARQAHEGVLASFFILLSLYFAVRFSRDNLFKHFLISLIAVFLSTFSYHTGRIFFIVIGIYLGYLSMIKGAVGTNLSLTIKRIFSIDYIKKKTHYLFVLSAVFIIPFLTDIYYGVSRVSNLLFYKNAGFVMRINEYIGEHPNRLFHNKVIEGIRDVVFRYFDQISPNFFLIQGSSNPRFGYPGLSLLTPIVFVFFAYGIYLLFKNKQKHRLLLLALLLVSPLGNAFTWQGPSLIRVYFMIFPILLISSYAVVNLYKTLVVCAKSGTGRLVYSTVIICIVVIHLLFLILAWDVYLNHYPKRAHVERSWQCGYKELADYIKLNYSSFDTFYITKKYGQPYIFLLYYLKIDPKSYQKNSVVSSPDQYGFSQVERFDKFVFSLPSDRFDKNSVTIGFPDDFDAEKDGSPTHTISYGYEDIFLIYENKGPTRIK